MNNETNRTFTLRWSSKGIYAPFLKKKKKKITPSNVSWSPGWFAQNWEVSWNNELSIAESRAVLANQNDWLPQKKKRKMLRSLKVGGVCCPYSFCVMGEVGGWEWIHNEETAQPRREARVPAEPQEVAGIRNTWVPRRQGQERDWKS